MSGFSGKIVKDLMVKSARHCCVCHKTARRDLEIHHIIPKSQGGEDTYENAIVLCFECHSAAGHYNPKHSKGTKLSPVELIHHREKWYTMVQENKIKPRPEYNTKLIIVKENSNEIFEPLFVEYIITYGDKREHIELFKEVYQSPNDMYKKMKEEFNFEDESLKDFKTFEEYVDTICYDESNFKGYLESFKDNIQPISHSIGGTSKFNLFEKTKTHNLSICCLKLQFQNFGPDVLEDYKLYLNFENIITADTINKRTEVFDLYKYNYNVHFKGEANAEFKPETPILVQNDFVDLDPICFAVIPKKRTSYLNWELKARNYEDSGRISLKINPIIERIDLTSFVNNPEDYNELRIISCDFEKNRKKE